MSGKPWSYRRAMWVAMIVPLIMSAMVAGAASVVSSSTLSGVGIVAGVAMAVLPLMIAMLAHAPRMDREFEELLSRGYSERDARRRVARNAAWIKGPAMLVVGAWGGLIWLYAVNAAPASPTWTSLRLVVGVVAFQVTAMGGFVCWIAWRVGRIEGHGRRCGRCGYPTPPAGIPVCTECGRVFAYAKDTSDGRVDRSAWMLLLAIAATLVVGGIVVAKGWRTFAIMGMGVASNATLVSAASGADPRMAASAWDELSSRALSDSDRAALLSGVLTLWETDGALPWRTAKNMTGFIHEELIAGKVDEQSLDRMIALAPLMATDLYGRQLLAPLRRVLTPEQAARLAGDAADSDQNLSREAGR